MKAKDLMNPDAMAWLRRMLVKAESEGRLAPVFVRGVTVDDLRAVLDRAALLDEALDALERLTREVGLLSAAVTPNELRATEKQARAVLAKAGR